jgi:ERF superfamily
MPGRRTSTTTQPTPIEETEPTSQPVPEPDNPQAPKPGDGPDSDEAPVTHSRVAHMIDSALANALTDIRRGPFGIVTAQQEDYPLSVHEAIAEVTRRIDAIEKAHRTEQGAERYLYRGIDDVFAALHPALGDVGLVIMPGRMVEHRRETRQTAKGGTLNVAMVRVRYRLIGPDGSRASGEAWGEAHDSGDKATQKALSQAYKSFALQLFSIPTEASAQDDPDRTNEEARPFTADEQERAGRAYEAALAADTLEALVGIRRRAEHLLGVPVRMADGTLHPLRLLFDSRRMALEGVTG